MTPNEIRNYADFGDPNTSPLKVQAAMAVEIAAQLAELNQELSRIADNIIVCSGKQ